MVITKKIIINWNSCDDYTPEKIEALIKKYCKKGIVKFNDVVCANENNDLPNDDFLCLVLRPEFIPDAQLHQIAIFCWEKIAKPVWEKYYPDDKRPHEAVRIKKLWLKGKATDQELSAAWAPWAPGVAVWNARAAVRAAVWNAVGAAVGAAARDAALNKIIKYVIKCAKNKGGLKIW